MQITRFFKQGYSLIDLGSEPVMAAVNPGKTELVIAVNNITENEMPVKMDLSSFGNVAGEILVFRTSTTENCQLLDLVVVENQSLNYVSPPRSLTTFVVSK